MRGKESEREGGEEEREKWVGREGRENEGKGGGESRGRVRRGGEERSKKREGIFIQVLAVLMYAVVGY